MTTVTAIPRYEAGGGAALRSELFAPSGESLVFEQGLLSGGQSATEYGRVESQGLRTAGPVDGGRYRLAVSVETGDLSAEPIALELGVQFLAVGESVGLAREAGAVATPTPTATATPALAPSTAGVAWVVVFGVALGGLLLGLAAAAILGRRK